MNRKLIFIYYIFIIIIIFFFFTLLYGNAIFIRYLILNINKYFNKTIYNYK